MKRLFQTLKSYMEGQLSSRQERQFRDWLDSEEGKTTFSEWVENRYRENDLQETHPEWQADQVLKRILEKKRKADSPVQRDRGINVGVWTYRIAASILLLFFIGHQWYGSFLKSGIENVQPEYIPVLITKQNPKGQKSRFVLPDSSIVYLNADSKLYYLQNFAGGREVELIGEAFFDVKSDSLNPFVVKSPRLSSTALGTTFTVSAYPDQQNETVALATGKVLVANSEATQTVLLHPGEGTYLKENSKEFTKISVNADMPALWTRGILHFEKVSWSEVIVLLERWYGVSIHVSGSWSDPMCSGSFKQNEYLNNVLQVLGHSIGFSYSINGKNVNIHLKP